MNLLPGPGCDDPKGLGLEAEPPKGPDAGAVDPKPERGR